MELAVAEVDAAAVCIVARAEACARQIAEVEMPYGEPLEADLILTKRFKDK